MMKSFPNVIMILNAGLTAALKVVGFQLSAVRNQLPAGLDKRDQFVSTSIQNYYDITYTVNVSIGTPGQSLMLQIGLADSHTWLPRADSILCQNPSVNCTEFGVFEPSLSSSFNARKDENQVYLTVLGIGQASGPWVSDDMVVAGIKMSSFNFAMLQNGTSTVPINGIMGLGYDSPSSPNTPGTTSLISSLVEKGYIHTQAYSLWLNGPSSAGGTMLFGGIDTDKFEPPLISIPNIPNEDRSYSAFRLPLTGLALTFATSGPAPPLLSAGFSEPAIIASDVAWMYLPNDTVNALWKDLNAVIRNGTGYLPCDEVPFYLTFAFNNDVAVSIDVSSKNLLFKADYNDNAFPGLSTCYLAIASTDQSSGLIYLGEAFMRSAYMVFDLDHHLISVAQAHSDVTVSNLVEITGSSISGASIMATLASINPSSSAASAIMSLTTFVPTVSSTATTGIPSPHQTASSVSATRVSISVMGMLVLLATWLIQ